MRTASSKKIRDEALSLKPAERAQLANLLFNSLSHRRIQEIQAAWKLEVSERISTYRAGKMPTEPAEAVTTRLRETFGWEK